MEIPDRECPNFWEDCRDCEYALNVTCPKIKAERAEMQKIADATEVRSIQQAHEDAKKITGIADLINADHRTFWACWGKYSHRFSVNEKEVLPLYNVPSFGGGSKSGKHHKTAPKTIPEYLKTWGT